MAAKKRDPCYRCGGGRILTAFKHVEGGTCFRCRGTGIDPGRGAPSDKWMDVEETGKPDRKAHPSAEQSRRMADTQLELAADFFKQMRERIAQDGDFAGQSLADWQGATAYIVGRAGERIGFSIVDFGRFQRAVTRGRALVPADYRDAFEQGLADGIHRMADKYEGIVWEGR